MSFRDLQYQIVEFSSVTGEVVQVIHSRRGDLALGDALVVAAEKADRKGVSVRFADKDGIQKELWPHEARAMARSLA